METAKEILRQLGGNKFVVMTGAKNLIGHPSALSFRLPGKNFARHDINYVKITLNSMDLYDLEFGRVRGKTYKVISLCDGIYNDQLQAVFTAETGLDTHL
jgi:hypothetical protein